MDDLVRRWRATGGRHDDLAYASERAALEALADLDTEAARKALAELVRETGSGPAGQDVRRMLVVLAAFVRRGGPAEMDEAIRAAERAREPYAVAALARVLAGALRADAREHLRSTVLLRGPPVVRAQAARALGAMGDKASVVPLLLALRDEDVVLRTEALFALGELREERAVPSMTPFLRVPDARVREATARALGVLGSARALAGLVQALDDPAPLVVESAANALALLGQANAVAPLLDRWDRTRGKDLRLEDGFERALARLTGVSLGGDPELWRAWWKENRDREGPARTRPEAPTTIAGPRYYGFGVRSSRVTFVVDVSRSMGWNDRLDTARKELLEVLAHLPPTTRFDLVRYSDRAHPWAGRLEPATPENVRKASRFVDRLEPENATNIHDALRVAFLDEDVDTIYFLSDGTPTAGSIVDPEALLAEVRAINRWRRIRIHTIALTRGEPPAGFAGGEDPAASAAFMKRLAEENDGSTREIR